MNATVLRDCLRRVIPHVNTERIALTGSVAIALRVDGALAVSGGEVAAADIDFVVDDVDAVRQTVTSDFLVSHFHLPQPGYAKFLIQLVEQNARLRLDFFPDTLGALSRATIVDIGGIRLRVLRAADILEHKLALLATASADTPIDRKHYADAKRLGIVCGRHVPPVDDSHLATATYSRDVDEICSRCRASRHPGFALASKRAIVDVLGYV